MLVAVASTESSKILSRMHFSQTRQLRARMAAGRETKIFDQIERAVEDIKDESTLLVGGFGMCGVPENLIAALKKKNATRLTVISNNCGTEELGLGLILKNGQIKRLICSHIGENKEASRQYLAGALEVELVPQGSLAERIRAAGAGVPAFYTPTGVDTFVEKGGWVIRYDSDGSPIILSEPREVREFSGRKCVLETGITGDYALIRAWRADKKGNLQFRYTARNFNPVMATATAMTIAEVEEIVENGAMCPDQVHLPGIYVHRIVKAKPPCQVAARFFAPTKLLFDRKEKEDNIVPLNSTESKRHFIARRAALEIKRGMSCNLGIGIPTLVLQYLPKEVEADFQSENGLLGMGGPPEPDKRDADLVNAGKEFATAMPGSSTFDSADSFGMIRGGHVDLTILGALQVSRDGDLASWIIPGQSVKGLGGAMDLVSNAARVIVVMEHVTKNKAAKILEKCTLSLTGAKVVSRIITDMGVFDVDRHRGLTLVEIAPGTTLDRIKVATDCHFDVSEKLQSMPAA